MTIEKTYISANQLLEDSFRLANQVFDSGFRPTHIVGIWRGGAPNWDRSPRTA
jgi:hypoxanthine phosphoribosyltransferase